MGTAPCARGNPTLVIDNSSSRAIVFGGWDKKTRFNDVHVLDLQDWEWSKVDVMRFDGAGGPTPSPRSDHSSVLWAEGRAMVVFGGSGDYGIPLNDVWLLHMPVQKEDGGDVSGDVDIEKEEKVKTAWRWEKLLCSGPLPAPRTSHASVMHGK